VTNQAETKQTGPAAEPTGGVPTALGPGSYQLEQPGPLSGSLLWRIQRNYYARAGVAAWSQDAVPMWVTSNPFIAGAYARLIGAFWRDWARSGGLNPRHPLYIVELAAGSGRLAYLLIRSLLAGAEEADGPGAAGLPSFKYVMTEYNAAMLGFWAEHPALRPLVEAGWLDFARFDADSPADLYLEHSQVTLSPGSLANPLVLVANYFFDSIAQDVFYVEGGQLYESRAALHSSEAGLRSEDDNILGRVQLGYERVPVSLPYYGDADLDALLKEYRQTIKAGAVVLPTVGLRCLDHFRRLSAAPSGEGRLLYITADKGYHLAEDLQGRLEPRFALHTKCFSVEVNYDALARYCGRHAGAALTLPHRHQFLDTCAFLLGEPPGGTGETRRAYRETVSEFGPEDLDVLQDLLYREHNPLRADQVLSLLRLSRWDPRIFHLGFQDLVEGLGAASEAVRAGLRAGLERVWGNYYHIGEKYDLAYDLGVLAYKLRDYAGALGYFERSLELYGMAGQTLYNISLCQHHLGDRVAALDSASRAEELDPGYEKARALARRLREELPPARAQSGS
jgi:tetratricopeptide (TPR) repeat protein